MSKLASGLTGAPVDTRGAVEGDGLVLRNGVYVNERVAVPSGSNPAIKVIRKEADESVDTSITLQDDDELTFAIGANETWLVTAHLYPESTSATPDFRAAFTVPSGATGFYSLQGPSLDAANTVSDMFSQSFETFGTGLQTGVPASATATRPVTMTASVKNGSTPGSVTLQWAQSTSDATATVLKAGSYLIAWRTDQEGVLLAGYSPILDHKPTTDTPDDEFDSTTLAGKWTVVDGSSGTVDLVGRPASDTIYDLTTRPGWLLLQGFGTNSIALRQDYTIPDGSSILIAMAVTLAADSSTANGWANEEFAFNLSLNDTDTGPTDGNYARIKFDPEANQFRFSALDTGGIVGLLGDGAGPQLGQLFYMRIAREGSNYLCYMSFEGATWTPLGTATPGATATNIWINATAATPPDPAPIIAIDWIRQGTNNLDPWSHSGLIQLDTIVTRVKTADEGVTTSTTIQDDDELIFPIGINETWIMDAYLLVDGPVGGDIKVGVKGPSGVAGQFTVTGPGTTATTFENATTNNQITAVGIAPIGLPAGTLGVGSDTLVEVHAVIRNGATAGDVTIQWAQNTSSGTTRVLTDSYLEAVKN